MNCEAVRELLEEYALGLLDDTLRRQVEEHLALCPACREVLAEYQETLAHLPLALATVSPHHLPPTLKDRLLRQLDDNPDEMNVAELAPLPGRSPTSGNALPNSTTGSRLWVWPIWSQRRLRLAALAITLLFLLTLAWSIHLTVVLARERALRAEFADLVGQQQELVLEVVDSSRTTRRILLPPEGDSRAYGKLFTRSDMVHVVAMAARLPPPPPGSAYHLWLTQDGETQLAGLFQVNRDGFGLLLFDAATQDPIFASAQVTLQPIGSTAPAGEIVLVWQIEE
ncbi:MAG: hypothetical protein DCC55_14915 [Chloroflexi bacterium]|nr:MAG: hypothetical protein DCC55_14915 [Chloroflexota bacterium]